MLLLVSWSYIATPQQEKTRYGVGRQKENTFFNVDSL